MAAANFMTMNYDLPLIVCDPEFYEDEDGNFDEDLYLLCRYDAKKFAEKFTDDLEYYSVVLKSGYYEGFQFWVEESDSTSWEYDEAEEESAAELGKIREWLYSLRDNGFIELAIVARFSNGETWYSKKVA